MRIHQPWIIEPKMDATADVEKAAFLSRELEDLLSRVEGVKLPRARKMVAEKTKISAGTLENLRREPPRLKSIPGWVTASLAAFTIRILEAEMTRIAHDLEIARQINLRPSEDEIRAARAAVENAKTLVKKIKGRGR